jgi:hypothetical protein
VFVDHERADGGGAFESRIAGTRLDADTSSASRDLAWIAFILFGAISLGSPRWEGVIAPAIASFLGALQ